MNPCSPKVIMPVTLVALKVCITLPSHPSATLLTWAVEQYVVILHMTQAFLQPVEVVGEVLHAEDQASVRAESERMVLHHVIHLDELTDV